MNNLIKESSLTIEVDRAEDGLISMFNTPGPGLEPSQIDQYKHLLSSYSDSKAKFEQYDARSKIEKILKEDPFNVPARMAIMNYVNQMRQIRSLKEMRQFPSAKDIVQRHSMGKRTEDEISEHLLRLQEWKLYEIYRKDMEYLSTRQQKMASLGSARALREIIDGIKTAGTLGKLADIGEIINAARSGGNFFDSELYEKLQEAFEIKSHMILAAQACAARLAVMDNPQISAQELGRMLKQIDDAANIHQAPGEQDTYAEMTLPPALVPYPGKGETSPLISLTILPPEITLGQGDENASPKAIGTDQGGSQWDMSEFVSWRSSNVAIADIIAGKLLARSRGTADIVAIYESLESKPMHVTVEPPKLVSIVASSDKQKGDMLDTFTLTASGAWSDGTSQDLTNKVTWILSNQRVFSVKNNVLIPRRLGVSIVQAQYNTIGSQPLSLKVALSLRWILGIIFTFFLWVVTIAAAILAILLYQTEKRKQALRQKRNNIREYLIDLYEIMLHILRIAGLKGYRNTPYLHLARNACESLGIPYEAIFKMTRAYEEARFSSHVMNESEVLLMEKGYNDIVQDLLKKGSSRRRLGLMCLLVINKFPLVV